MQGIRGQAKNIRALLQNARFDIDYFQREYQWREEQVTAALGDLTDAFRKSEEQPRGSRDTPDSDQYYFLGSIVITESAGKRFIVDGQQRITTVTLLLIALHHRLPEGGQRTALQQLIYSYRSGRESFNLDVDDRKECLEGLFRQGTFEDDGKSTSVRRMVDNYELIENELNEAIDDSERPSQGDDPLPLALFVDWLIENVYVIEVTASSDADAYAVFETLNDRGLPLTPAELLKSFLLSRIDADDRHLMNELWKDHVAGLRKQLNWQGADADFIKTWLCSQYMETKSDREGIDSQFHRWVGDNTERLKLHDSMDFRRFIETDFRFYARWYEEVQRASWNWTEGFEAIYRNRCAGLRDRNNLYLAGLVPTDDDSTVRRKIRTVAAFIEVLVARVSWKAWAYQYPGMYSAMLGVMVKIRRQSIDSMISVFERADAAEDWWFVDRFKERSGPCGWPGNRRRTHRMLARMTEYIEVQAGGPSRYRNFVRTGRAGYDVEHIWAKHWKKRFEEPYPQETDFNRDRNRIGGLVLLPSSVNQGLRDKTFTQKRSTYEAKTTSPGEESPRNLLARSLVTLTPPSDFPAFGDEIERLPFQAFSNFRTPMDLEAREQLYRELARTIWSMDAIREAGKASPETE